MKRLIIILCIIALFASCSDGVSDVIADPDIPGGTDDPNNPADPSTGGLIRQAIPVPEYLYDVALGAWIIREAVVSKNIVATADPAAKYCTNEGSFYLFTGDKKIVEYEIKEEEWGTMLRACIVTKELYEYEGKEFDYIAVPRYIPPYVPENKEPVVPLLHFYVLDKDNNVVYDYDITTIEPGDPVGWYNYCIANNYITMDVETRDMNSPELAPHRWIGGGTKEVVLE